jgi:hypothetical protein
MKPSADIPDEIRKEIETLPVEMKQTIEEFIRDIHSHSSAQPVDIYVLKFRKPG